MTAEKRAELQQMARNVRWEIRSLALRADDLLTLLSDDDISSDALVGVAVNALHPSELIAAIQVFRAREEKP